MRARAGKCRPTGCSLLAGSFPASRLGILWLYDESDITRVSTHTGIVSDVLVSALYWLLLPPTYLVTARIWRLSPLHFAHAIKKAERNLSVATIPLVELASEGSASHWFYW